MEKPKYSCIHNSVAIPTNRVALFNSFTGVKQRIAVKPHTCGATFSIHYSIIDFVENQPFIAADLSSYYSNVVNILEDLFDPSEY
jgi:hypothetical protein